ncbi:NAD(P)H-binding protein [Actinoplanes sp. NBC_00393]|uniref:NAD(P)H-binding protein n=1 Tax=Actinoplanes sp. NBC_00393 TaxID=2975953 RepID=UPI002E200A59
MTILVLGATGKTGRRLVPRLRAAGAEVRAAARTGEVRFDWSAPDTWPAALGGARALYLVAPDDPAPTAAFVAQAAEAGVRRVVALSGRNLDKLDENVFPGMLTAERVVRESGLAWTIIRANNFDQNFDEDLWRAPLLDGRLALPIGDVPEPFIDADDVADVAAALLTGDGHEERVYELSGPRGLTFAEATEIIARAAGRQIRYVELSPAEYREELLAGGYPASAVDALDGMFAAHRDGITAETTDGVRQVLGRDPVDFTAYAERAARAGAWSG